MMRLFRKRKMPTINEKEIVLYPATTTKPKAHSTIGELFINNMRDALDLCQYDLNLRRNMAFFAKNQLAEKGHAYEDNRRTHNEK